MPSQDASESRHVERVKPKFEREPIALPYVETGMSSDLNCIIHAVKTKSRRHSSLTKCNAACEARLVAVNNVGRVGVGRPPGNEARRIFNSAKARHPHLHQ